MKKILFISNIANEITNFTRPSIEVSQSMDYEFHLAANCSDFSDVADSEREYNIKIHHVDIDRNPFNKNNIIAFKQMLDLIKKENIDVIHCNTPIGGVLGRFCGKKAKVPKIIYTAHGFHFFEGNSKIKNLIFKTAERIMAKHTDAIITINQEDYSAAKEFTLRKNGQVYYIPGVGVDTKKYKINNFNKEEYKKILGLSSDDIVLIAMGDLIARKNYEASIKAIAKTNNKKLKFLICGKGPRLSSLKYLAKSLEVEDKIHFLGYRKDIKELLNISDIFLFTTYQEGLPRSMMEAMSAGLPCVVSKIRGNTDLIEDGVGGFLRDPNDIEGFSGALNKLASDKDIREQMRRINLEKVKKFDVKNIKKEVKSAYTEILLGEKL